MQDSNADVVTSSAMSKPRIWLLLLMALILPFKGAMAAAGMFCHLGSDLPMSAIVQPHQHHAGGADHDHARGNGTYNDAQSGVHDDSGPSPGSSSCTICSAVCSAPPLPPAGVSWQPLAPTGAERFPALAPPRPSAVSSGLERPPRTV